MLPGVLGPGAPHTCFTLWRGTTLTCVASQPKHVVALRLTLPESDGVRDDAV